MTRYICALIFRNLLEILSVATGYLQEIAYCLPRLGLLLRLNIIINLCTFLVPSASKWAYQIVLIAQ